MKPYPSYKSENRLPGIDRVPAHWKVVRNSLVFIEVNETGFGDLELLSITADRGIMKQSETGRKERASEDRSTYKRILKGDIGYNLMNAFIGAIGVSNHDGIISPAYAVCRSRIAVDSNYFHYLFRTGLYLTEFDRYAYGIMDERNRLYFDNFKKIYVPLPPLDEQRSIVRFINQKLTQIDQFICYKQRLIELLNEQEITIIDRAVTRGINSDSPMRVSRIKYLEYFPQHWAALSLKRLINSIDQGSSPLCHNQPATPDQWGVLKVGAVNGGIFREEQNKALPDELEPLESHLIKVGDVLISRANTRELLGSAALVKQVRPRLLLCDKLYRLNLNSDRINKEFFIYMMRTKYIRYQLESSATGSSDSMQNISQEIVRSLKIVIPSKSEQDKIVDYLNNEIAQIHHAIAQTEKEIELIQEYRTTLISDAITGKIDVRDTIEAGVPVAAGGD